MPKLVKQEVKTFVTNTVCEKCDNGYMMKVSTESDTIDLTVSPPTFKHVCNKCGCVEWSSVCYPLLTYDYVDV